MRPTRPDLSGRTIAAKFKLEKRLGQGHFGDVYFGEQTVVGRQFALKVVPVSPSTHDASALEARLLNLSKHPHVVAVRSAEYWQDANGRDFCLIEMAYVPGGNLQDLIDRGAPIGELIECMKNVLFALDHAHGLDIVHRDVKPANILLGEGGKLSDFGIAMVSATGASASEYIYGGNLAPECQGTSPIFTPASDVFAAGLTLLRGLNLISNWGATLAAVSNIGVKMGSGAFVPELGFHSRVPSSLKKIVRKACAPTASKRYTSAAAFRDALEKLKIARNWTPSSNDSWSCLHKGGEEVLTISLGRSGYNVDYKRNGRRKVEACRTGLTRNAALQHVYEVIADTTLD